MKTAFEGELSEALARRASAVTPEAAQRLCAIDYHPRRHRLGVPVALGAGAAASAATVGTVLAVVLGGTTPAYAGWSAAPTASSTGESPPGCITTLSSSGSDTGSWQTLLTDVRGPFTITLLQNGTSYATCFTGPSFTEVNRITSSSGSGGAQSGSLSVTAQSPNGGGTPPQGGVGSQVSLEKTSSGDLTQVLQNHLTTTADGPYTFIDGQVAGGVTGVTLVLNDGQDIVATVADGWLMAWWPGDTGDATSARVAKASGTTSEPLVPLVQSSLKFPYGQPGVQSPSQPTGPAACTKTTTPTTSSAPGVNCSRGSTASGNSGNSGNSGTSGTGSAPKTSSNP